MTPAPSIDSVTPPSAPSPRPQPPEPKPQDVQRARVVLLGGGMLLAMVYALWCMALLAMLPPADGGMQSLIKFGTMSAMVGAVVFGLVGLMSVLRVRSNAALPPSAKQRGLIRGLAFSVPGIALSIAVLVLINRQPQLALLVTDPAQADLVAPVTVTYSAELATQILAQRGTKVLQYKWDIDGDGKIDRQTVVPTLQTTYQRDGAYSTSVTLVYSAGGGVVLTHRIIISKAVFTVDPDPPIVNQPATFDASNLVTNSNDIADISWDFDGDGKPDADGKDTTATTTFYQTGSYPVSVTVQLNNKTQATYTRTVQVVNPPPLPFPITITTKPGKLISQAPFTVIFGVQTDETLSQVQWNFGDGTRSEGITDVPHTFTRTGTFTVVARARSSSGSLANITIPVQVSDLLQIPDLSFKGSPQPNSDTISGEIPLTVSLDPQTDAQFVTFTWEAPDATEVGSTDGQLQAIYRTPGTYKITMIAQDAQQKVLRKQFTVNAQPVSSLVTFQMDPKDGVAPLKVDFDASETDIPDETISGFEWDFGDSSDKQFGGAQIEHEFEEPGTYTVTLQALTNDASPGQQYTATQTIVVRQPPLQSCFLASRSKVTLDSPYVSFDSSCTTGDVSSYAWDFGDSSQSSDQSPIHQFTKQGTFSVKLTVTDSSGRKSTKSSIITVE